jgi:protein-arginine kinase
MKTFIIWVNEEDHLRIISLQKGCNIKQVYNRLVKGIEKLQKSIHFVEHEKFGFLTFCPTNIGTSIRASVHIKLPKLGSSDRLSQICDSLGLQSRGTNGEHSESKEGIYDISNKVRIGKTEIELINSLCVGIKILLDEEYKIK